MFTIEKEGLLRGWRVFSRALFLFGPLGDKLKNVYRRSKFLEVLIDIRQEMAREADFDTDLFVEMLRSRDGDTVNAAHSMVEEPSVKENKGSPGNSN